MNTKDDMAAARELLDLVNGSWVAQACYVAARLGIADLLAAGPRTAEELAAATGTHAPALRRLLGALGSVAVCQQHDDGSFEMTRLGRLLRADVPCSMRAWTLQWGGEAWRVWANLLFPVDWDASAKSAILAVALLIGSSAIVYAACATRLPRRILLSMLALTIGALVPAYHLALIGDNLNGSRILYLPAVGFCVLCAHLVRWERLVIGALIVCTAAVLLHNLDAWHRNAVLADQVCKGASSQAPVHDLNGVVFFANGYKECVELNAGRGRGQTH